MQTLLRIAGTAFLIIGAVGLLWQIPTRFMPSGVAVIGGLLLLGISELLSRRNQ